MLKEIELQIAEGMKAPEYYIGNIPSLQRQGYVGTFGRSRDSDNIEEVNYDHVLKYLEENYEQNEDFQVNSASHWAVGWVESIFVKALQCSCDTAEDADFEIKRYEPRDSRLSGIEFKCRTCGEFGQVTLVIQDIWGLKKAVEEYPVLDDEELSRREYEDTLEYLECEVGKEDAPKLFDYLFDTYSVSRADEISNKWIDEWKVKNGYE